MVYNFLYFPLSMLIVFHIMFLLHAQVNAQVLASAFTPGSQHWIRLGEALGKLLKACNSTKQLYDQVHITTQGLPYVPKST